MSSPDQILRAAFGLERFRPHQREVIEDVLRGDDVLCVMPTGAGKSLCFQLPALALGGLTIVVSPLISLMADQVAQLRARKIAALQLNSSQSIPEQREVIRTVARDWRGLLYVAPERFAAPSFQWLIARVKPRLFVIDEAHCVSFWGHDFRPEYMKLGAAREQLGNPVTIALTATATRHVQRDIVKMIGLRSPRVHVTGFDRPNLAYTCRRFEKDREKEGALLRFLSTQKGTGIVYCSTRRAVEELTSIIERQFRGRTVCAYHAGMSQDERRRHQQEFMESDDAIVVATNAFGMGINKPDIRFVVHYNLPGSVEAYYQEAGRAGRDGRPARCLLYFSGADLRTQRFFIQQIGDNNPNLDAQSIKRLQSHAGSKLELMLEYAEEQRCRRGQILEYFGEEAKVTDCNCDHCELVRSPHRYSPDVTQRFGSSAVPQLTEDKAREIARKLRERPRGMHASRGETPAAKKRTYVPDAEFDAEAQERFERLRTWRLEYAREQGWKAFQVLHDSTLKTIAAMRPRTIRELMEVPGIGPKRAEAFGPALLAALAMK